MHFGRYCCGARINMLHRNKSGSIHRHPTSRDQENSMSTATLRYSGPLTEAKSQPAAAGRSLLARVFDAMVEARMRQATRELAMHRHLLPENSAEKTGSAFTSDGRLVR